MSNVTRLTPHKLDQSTLSDSPAKQKMLADSHKKIYDFFMANEKHSDNQMYLVEGREQHLLILLPDHFDMSGMDLNLFKNAGRCENDTVITATETDDNFYIIEIDYDAVQAGKCSGVMPTDIGAYYLTGMKWYFLFNTKQVGRI